MGWNLINRLTIYNASESEAQDIWKALKGNPDTDYMFNLGETFEDTDPQFLPPHTDWWHWGCGSDDKPTYQDGFFFSLSRTFPNVLFEIEWQDDCDFETGRRYFRNGKLHDVIGDITFPPFNEMEAKEEETTPPPQETPCPDQPSNFT
jgi:hypothetical protein